MSSTQPENQRRPRRPDLFGLVASGFLGLFFAFYFFIFTAPLCRTGSVLVILSSAGVFLRLITNNRQTAPNSSIRNEIQQLRGQVTSLRKTLLFYVLPLLAGLNLFCFGLPRPGVYKFIFLAATILICLAVFWVSHQRLTRAVRELESEIANFPK